MERGLSPPVRVFPTLEEAAGALAQSFVLSAREAIKERGRALIVLTGGTTTRALYQVLLDRNRTSLDWDRIEFFWGDERCVPASSDDSNYGVARRMLLDPLGVPEAHVHPMRGDLTPPARAAEEYSREIVRVVDHVVPWFDLVLLGLGADGHTASLFPRSRSLAEARRPVISIPHPAGHPRVPRLTLTRAALGSSRAIAFLVAGASKAQSLASTLAADQDADFPASLLRPVGTTTWYVDVAAAAKVPPERLVPGTGVPHP